MPRPSEIYSYKVGSTADVEQSYFSYKGRIILPEFWERLLLLTSLFMIINILLDLVNIENVSFVFTFASQKCDGIYLLRWLIGGYFLYLLNIQAIKRAHDCNESGVMGLFRPQIYFYSGTKSDNDFGIDPRGVNKIQFFDELRESMRTKKSIFNNRYIITLSAYIIVLILLIYGEYTLIKNIKDVDLKKWNNEGQHASNYKNSAIDYLVCIVGEDTWMSENLNVDIFSNGDKIYHARTNAEWLRAMENEIPAWCFYANDSTNEYFYGRLYNWYAVRDPRGLAPNGWHIPTSAEWKYMVEEYGGDREAGKKMKGNIGWNLEQKYGRQSKFKGYPGGYRNAMDGSFEKMGYYGYWWTSDTKTIDKARNRGLEYDNNTVNKGVYFKGGGFSVRCIKDK